MLFNDYASLFAIALPLRGTESGLGFLHTLFASRSIKKLSCYLFLTLPM